MKITDAAKKDIIVHLQKEILRLQGFKQIAKDGTGSFGLGPAEAAFPNGVFPRATIHEFLSEGHEHAAACGGFVSGLLKTLMEQGNTCVWISTCRTIFPPALHAFGISPDKIFFIDLKREQDVLWVMEESLKCEALSAVVAELKEISFAASRRLQLAVEKSKVTGFILRNDEDKVRPTAAVARWRISPAPSETEAGMPGVGFPRWNVELLKVRNGNPGAWTMEWSGGTFNTIIEQHIASVLPAQQQKIG